MLVNSNKKHIDTALFMILFLVILLSSLYNNIEGYIAKVQYHWNSVVLGGIYIECIPYPCIKLQCTANQGDRDRWRARVNEVMDIRDQ